MRALAGRAGELTRSWASALVQSLPPERIGEVPLAAIAEEGPELVLGMLSSLASDAGLARLESLHTAPGSLLGERSPGEAVRMVEELRGVVWEAALDVLTAGNARAREVAALGDRLAYVCSTVAAAVEAGRCEPAAARSADLGVRPEALQQEMAPAPALGEEIPEDFGFLVDEHDEPQERRIEIRDIRPEQLQKAWLAPIAQRLERFAEDSVPFAVLLSEVNPSGRSPQDSRPQEDPGELSGVREALLRELGPMDLLSEQSEGRYWLIVPEADASTARLLAERLAQSVRSALAGRGPDLEIAVGIALCPDHGSNASTLCSHAEVDIYAARAAGSVVAPADDPAGGP